MERWWGGEWGRCSGGGVGRSSGGVVRNVHSMGWLKWWPVVVVVVVGRGILNRRDI